MDENTFISFIKHPRVEKLLCHSIVHSPCDNGAIINLFEELK